MIKLETYEKYCAGFKGSDEARRTSEMLFIIRNHFSILKKLDRLGNGCISSDELIGNWDDVSREPEDYLEPVVQKLDEVFDHIVENMRGRIRHENALMPICKANEFNVKSIAWLNKRAGRTLREKLSGTKSVMAVRRRMSPDIDENRLFKELARRVEDAIFLKNSALPEQFRNRNELALSDKLRRFRNSVEAKEILPWDNSPPDNALLSDRAYNAVWRAWNDLQEINSLIAEDCRNIERRLCNSATLVLIVIAGKRCDFPQLPIVYYSDRSGERRYRLKFFGETLHAVNPARNTILKITPLADEIALEYGDMKCTLKFVGLRLNIFDGAARSIDLTADNFFDCLSNVMRKLLGADFDTLRQLPPRGRLEGRTASVELFSLRPEVLHEGRRVIAGGAIMYQRFVEADKEFVADCFRSRALLMPEDGSIVFDTFASIIDNDNEPSIPSRLTARLNKFVHTDDVVIVCPDIFSEFQLAELKRHLKLRYNRVRFIPKSLTAIFRYVRSEHFATNFEVGDSILIMDKTFEGCSFTLIKSRFDSTVIRDIPEMKGIAWEHHPAYCADTAQFGELEPSDDALKILRVMSVKDFTAEVERTAFIDRSGQLKDFHDDVEKLKQLRLPIKAELDKYIAGHRNLLRGGKIWLMPLSDELDCNDSYFDVIDYADQCLLEGANFFDELRLRTDASIWRDCLPEISIKRLYGTFDLVRDITFEYGGGNEMLIPIPQTFTLQKGQRNYRFRLQMSDGNDKNAFEAVLEHKNFPLKNDVECRLIMKYTCGNDNPYSLKFAPIDKKAAGFNEALVRWERAEDYPFKDLIYPKFPRSKSWSSLREYPRKNHGGTENLLDKAIRQLREIASSRYSLDVSDESWFLNREQEWQLNSTFFVDGREYDITFFKNNFVAPDEFRTDIKRLVFSINREWNYGTFQTADNGSIYAKNIAVDRGDKTFYDTSKLNSLLKGLLFCLNLIYFDGRSSEQFDCPPRVASGLKEGLRRVYEMYRALEPDSNDRSKVFNILCVAAKDVDPMFIFDVNNYIAGQIHSAKTARYEVGFVLGDLSETWQRELFERIEQLNPINVVCILAKAVWRNDYFIKNLPLERTKHYFEFAINLLVNAETLGMIYQKPTLMLALEFIMAVFRLREDADDELSRYLSLNNPLLRQLCAKLEQFIKSKFLDPYKTRIELEINRSAEFAQYKIHDFFYALLVCITGETGESDIVISSVSN